MIPLGWIDKPALERTIRAKPDDKSYRVLSSREHMGRLSGMVQEVSTRKRQGNALAGQDDKPAPRDATRDDNGKQAGAMDH